MQLYEQIEKDFLNTCCNLDLQYPSEFETCQKAFKQSFIKFLESECERLKDKFIATLGKAKKYDGNNLASACDHYHIAAKTWDEIIRYEDGYNQALSETISHYQNMIKELHG